MAELNSIPYFINIRPTVVELNHADGQTYMFGPICAHRAKNAFFHADLS
jgi:hypothetical protein